MIIDHHNRVCDCLKASLNGHHERPPTTVTTNFFMQHNIPLLALAQKQTFIAAILRFTLIMIVM